MHDPVRAAEAARLWTSLTTEQRLWIVRKALLLVERAPVLLDPAVRFAPREEPLIYAVEAWSGGEAPVTIHLLTKPGPAGWGATRDVYEFDAMSSERGNLFGPEDRTTFTTSDEGRFALGMVLGEILRLRGEA